MIYYQFDPEMDNEIIEAIKKSGQYPESITAPSNEMRENEEAYVFSNDDNDTGFLSLLIHDDQSLEIICLYMEEFIHSDQFHKKLLDFAVKRARYLGLSNIHFNRRIYNVEWPQLKMELGCTRIETENETINCIFLPRFSSFAEMERYSP